jgi:hypothetical protein
MMPSTIALTSGWLSVRGSGRAGACDLDLAGFELIGRS